MSEQVMEKAELKAAEETVEPVRTLEVVAAEIRALTANAINTIVEIGRRMVEAKEMLPHGEFGRWIKENTGYSSSTANNFMRIFEAYADPQGSLFGASVNCQTFGNLTYSKALALLEVPADEREDFVETHDVDGMSTRELQAVIKERDEAREEKRRIEEARDHAVEALARVNDRMEGMAAELEELKNRPRDVAVEKVADQEAIDTAVKEALEGQKEELEEARKKMEAAEKKAEKAETAAAKAKEEAEEAGKGSNEELEAARQEAEKAREEAEALRKELRLADTAVTTFRAYFTQWQQIYSYMEKALGDMEQETADKLRAAVKAQLEAWGSEYGN